MPRSRHDLFFRRNALATNRFTRLPPKIAFSVVFALGTVPMLTGHAQTLSPIGPRYPGEVILSERVVSPDSESLRATKRSASKPSPVPTLSIADKEPMSLSDGGNDSDGDNDSDGGSESDSAKANQTPILALGSEVWKRMLDLERENAELKAELEYERKLANYIERHQTRQENLNDTVAQLRQQLNAMRTNKTKWRLEQEKAKMQFKLLTGHNQELQKRNQEFEKKIQQLLKDLKQTKATISQQEERDATKTVSPRDLEPTRSSAKPELPIAGRAKERAKMPPRAERPGPTEPRLDKARSENARPEGARSEGARSEGARSENARAEKTRAEKPGPKKARPDMIRPEKAPAQQKEPAPQKEPNDDRKALLDSDQDPSGPIAFTVIPVGFEIPAGLAKPLAENESDKVPRD